jgi:hypothetical protein
MKFADYNFFLLFCMGVKHGLSHVKDIVSECLYIRIFGPKREEVTGGMHTV